MNIGIDGNEANVVNRVGVNTYAYNVLKELHKISQTRPKTFFTIFLSSKPHSHMPIQTKNWRYVHLPHRKLWTVTRLMPYLRQNSGNFDVFFTPGHYIPPFLPIPRVVAIMDLGYLENTGQFNRFDYWQLKYWSAYSIRAACSILSISAQTERDIVRHYQNASMKTFITHLAYDNATFTPIKSKNEILRVKNKYDIVNDYILFMSTLKPSKNIEGLMDAWAKVENKYKETTLVIAGKKGWLFDSIFEKAKELGIENRIRFTGFVDEDDKEHLIKGSKAFVLPSFWEGFGLDVLSSLASGVPSIISDIGSLPEVAGDAGVYVDPFNIDSIASAIDSVLSLSQKDYNKLSQDGIEQAKKFSWEKTAKLTLEVIENSI